MSSDEKRLDSISKRKIKEKLTWRSHLQPKFRLGAVSRGKTGCTEKLVTFSLQISFLLLHNFVLMQTRTTNNDTESKKHYEHDRLHCRYKIILRHRLLQISFFGYLDSTVNYHWRFLEANHRRRLNQKMQKLVFGGGPKTALDDNYCTQTMRSKRSPRAFENGPLMLRNIGGPLLNARTVRGQMLLIAFLHLRMPPNGGGGKKRHSVAFVQSHLLWEGTVFEPMNLQERDRFWTLQHAYVCMYIYIYIFVFFLIFFFSLSLSPPLSHRFCLSKGMVGMHPCEDGGALQFAKQHLKGDRDIVAKAARNGCRPPASTRANPTPGPKIGDRNRGVKMY